MKFKNPLGSHQLPARSRPAVEHLENRWTPSCVVSTTDGGHTLLITGDGTANHVTITQNDTTNVLEIECDGELDTYASSTITKIVVNLQGDKDWLDWNTAMGTSFKFGKTAVINTGGSDDHVAISIAKYPGTGVNASLDIDISMGGGYDYLGAAFGHKHGGTLKVSADMGGLDDTADLHLYGDITGGADVSLDLQGGTGNDWLGIDSQYDYGHAEPESIDLTGDATLAMTIQGGDGNDTIGVTYKGEMDGDLTLLLDGASNKDRIAADVLLKDSSFGSLDATLLGGLNDDRMWFRLVDEGGDANIVKALMDGGDGFDKYHSFNTTPNVAKTGFEGTFFDIAIPIPVWI